MDRLHPGGFRHAEQSLRIVERLEKAGSGLNLTWEVRQGIVSHSKPRGDFLGDSVPDGLSLEGQVCRVADAVAYLNHDLVDAFRAGIIHPGDLPSGVLDALGQRHSQRVNTMVSDIVDSSWAATGEDGVTATPPQPAMSPEIREAVNKLRDFMFERVYDPGDRGELGRAARKIVRLLYEYYQDNPEEVPPEYGDDERSAVDHVAGMTDLYALRQAERIDPAVAEAFRRASLAGP
jgi:dGTPase